MWVNGLSRCKQFACILWTCHRIYWTNSLEHCFEGVHILLYNVSNSVKTDVDNWTLISPICYDFNCLQTFAWHVRRLRRPETNFNPPLDNFLLFVKTVKIIFTSVSITAFFLNTDDLHHLENHEANHTWQMRARDTTLPNRNRTIMKHSNVWQPASVNL